MNIRGGISSSVLDVDECSGDNDCNENASCKNSPGSYRCQCTTGYEGDGKYCFGKLASDVNPPSVEVSPEWNQKLASKTVRQTCNKSCSYL